MSHAKNSTRNLHVVKTPKLSAKGHKTAAWLHDMENGPVTLERRVFTEVYATVLYAANQRQIDIESLVPADGTEDERYEQVLTEAENHFTKLNRLLIALEHYMPKAQRPDRQELIVTAAGGAA